MKLNRRKFFKTVGAIAVITSTSTILTSTPLLKEEKIQETFKVPKLEDQLISISDSSSWSPSFDEDDSSWDEYGEVKYDS